MHFQETLLQTNNNAIRRNAKKHLLQKLEQVVNENQKRYKAQFAPLHSVLSSKVLTRKKVGREFKKSQNKSTNKKTLFTNSPPTALKGSDKINLDNDNVQIETNAVAGEKLIRNKVKSIEVVESKALNISDEIKSTNNLVAQKYHLGQQVQARWKQQRWLVSTMLLFCFSL